MVLFCNLLHFLRLNAIQVPEEIMEWAGINSCQTDSIAGYDGVLDQKFYMAFSLRASWKLKIDAHFYFCVQPYLHYFPEAPLAGNERRIGQNINALIWVFFIWWNKFAPRLVLVKEQRSDVMTKTSLQYLLQNVCRRAVTHGPA